MPLRNYGLLTGILENHGPQDGGNPHYLLVIKAGSINYRISINSQSTPAKGDNPSPMQYQILKGLKGTSLARAIKNRNQFLLHSQDPSGPTLDYLRDGILKMSGFESVPAPGRRQSSSLQSLIADAAEATSAGGFVAVFGSGYPDQDDRPPGPGNDPQRNAFGFTGVDNVHMNQGNYLRVGTHDNGQYQENGIHQDGGILFFQSDGDVSGLFIKFAYQAVQTDDFGNPANTGVPELDSTQAIKPAVRKTLLKRPAALKKLSKSVASSSAAEVPISGTSGGTSTDGFVFGTPDTPDDPNHKFDDDDDSQYVNSPFVKNFGVLGVPEPVPGPRNRKYPTMDLADVLGKPAVNSIAKNPQIVFHVAGTTAESKYANEQAVADLMMQDFDPSIDQSQQPKFYYHVGDVVYYYGEAQFYYDQFYKPYKDYPGPIFAIPGNHDGITYTPSMVSLDGFIKAFCDDQPRHWSAAGGIGRSTMTQPGVYFTLNAPFVSIIGLYTNCSEFYGYIDDQQKLFFYNELMRLKPLRQSGEITAVILAVHHSPMSYNRAKPGSATLMQALDAACNQADFWPDAVFSGHAHIYQRMTRTVPGNDNWQIPYIISGSGGYTVNASQEVDKQDMSAIDASDPQNRLHQFYAHYGYMVVTVTPGDSSNPPTLRTEFRSPDINAGCRPTFAF